MHRHVFGIARGESRTHVFSHVPHPDTCPLTTRSFFPPPPSRSPTRRRLPPRNRDGIVRVGSHLDRGARPRAWSAGEGADAPAHARADAHTRLALTLRRGRHGGDATRRRRGIAQGAHRALSATRPDAGRREHAGAGAAPTGDPARPRGSRAPRRARLSDQGLHWRPRGRRASSLRRGRRRLTEAAAAGRLAHPRHSRAEHHWVRGIIHHPARARGCIRLAGSS